MGLDRVRLFKTKHRKSATDQPLLKFADGPKVSEALSGLSPFGGKINSATIQAIFFLSLTASAPALLSAVRPERMVEALGLVFKFRVYLACGDFLG
jgi:hypothetical protein